jgi:glycosyltransferase involved in cell wall biosynthesis
MCKVSIIIPNYNHASFLQQRIDSVLQQTYRDFEIIILDDCSTDESKTVIEKYRTDPNVSHIIYNKINSGSTFLQWAKGVNLARGELIWIAESDDWCENNFLGVLVDGIDRKSDCVLGYCQSYCIDENNNIMWKSGHPKLEEYIDGENFFKRHLLYGNKIFNASMALFKKEYFNLFSQEIAHYRFCGDWLSWISLTKYGDVFVSGKVLNFFRKHRGDVSSKMYLSGYNYIEELMVVQKLRNEKRIEDKISKKFIITKYQSFLAKRKQFNSEETEKIKKAFYSLFSGKFAFQRLLISFRVQAFLGKIKTHLNKSA